MGIDMKESTSIHAAQEGENASAVGNGVGTAFLADARRIIDTARANAVRSVDFNRVMMYWNLGKRIFEEEQQGKDRAGYGTYLVRNLSASLEPEYGSGFCIGSWRSAASFTGHIQL